MERIFAHECDLPLSTLTPTNICPISTPPRKPARAHLNARVPICRCELLAPPPLYINSTIRHVHPQFVFNYDPTNFIHDICAQRPRDPSQDRALFHQSHTKSPLSSIYIAFYFLRPRRRHWHAAPPERQRRPPSDHAQAAQRGDGTEGLEARRIEHEQVDGAREHGHAGREQRHGELVLRRGDGREQDDAGVDELLCGVRERSYPDASFSSVWGRMGLGRAMMGVQLVRKREWLPGSARPCSSSRCAAGRRYASSGCGHQRPRRRRWRRHRGSRWSRRCRA